MRFSISNNLYKKSNESANNSAYEGMHFMTSNPRLTFIIPAYLKSVDDRNILVETIGKILTICQDVVVISQGINPQLHHENIRSFHSQHSLGKWGAIEKASTKIFNII